MQLSPIVFKIRAQDTQFGGYVGGAVELGLAMEYSLTKEAAFVIQLSESASANNYDSTINQVITERFAVVVALDNGTSDRDKLGILAYDRLAGIRTEIFSAILGWQMEGAESLISYSGGKVLGVNRAWLWYQFEFSIDTRITDCDGVDNGSEDLEWFDRIYAQYILAPSDDLPQENIPVNFDVDMTQIIDFTTVEDEVCDEVYVTFDGDTVTFGGECVTFGGEESVSVTFDGDSVTFDGDPDIRW